MFKFYIEKKLQFYSNTNEHDFLLTDVKDFVIFKVNHFLCFVNVCVKKELGQVYTPAELKTILLSIFS